MGNSQRQGPLQGIRVLDLTSNISGPSATVILADLGAEVIKVERPGIGDDARAMTPQLAGRSAYFLALNRNKHSVVIDFRKPQGQALIRQLAGQVDVVIENFRRGVLEKYGLDAESLCAANPKLIYCSISAYGHEGPEKKKPGYDAVLQARTGIMSVTGSSETDLVRAGVSILDMGSGMWSAIAIMSALVHRERTGEGQIVGTSLLETGVYWMNYHLVAYQANQQDPVPMGASHAAFAPYGAYPTADDDLLIGISNDSLFHRFVKALGHEEWAEDDRFRDNAARIHNRTVLNQLISDCMQKLSCSEWIERLDAAGVPCSRIQKVSQVLRDPQIDQMDMLPFVDHADAGQVRLPRLPIRLTKSPPVIREAAPDLGQHTAEVLRRFGINEAELENLRNLGVIDFAAKEKENNVEFGCT